MRLLYALQHLIITAAMLCCFAAGVANTRAVYRTGIKQSNQETILSEAGFNLHANLPGGERLSTQLTDYTPAGGMLKSWQAVLFHSQAFFLMIRA